MSNTKPRGAGPTTLSLKVPELLEDKIETYAARHGRSKSSVVREAVRVFLDREGRGGADSFGARAADLSGVIEGEPDLSTNPEHLRDYGR